MRKFLFLIIIGLLINQCVNGQVSITTLGVASTQNFNGIGTSNNATLPAGFRASATASATSWTTGILATTEVAGTTGTGVISSSSAGGFYNFANGLSASSTERALGFLTSGGYASSRSILFAFTNNTGSTVTSIDVSWNYEKYRSGTRQIDWTFFHGSNAANPNTSVTTGDQSYTADANNTTVSNPPLQVSKSFTISGLSITNGSTYYLRWTYTGLAGSTNAQGLGFDDFSITCNGTPACTAPSQATSLSTSSPTVDGFSASWTAGSGNGTMIVVRPTAQVIAAPVSGSTYTPNLAWGSATQINTNNRVIFRATGTSAGPITGLTAETQYTATAYEYNTTGDCYNTTSPPSASIWTYSTEPTTHAASFTNTVVAYNQIDLTYSAVSGGADGYVILRRADGTAPTTSGIVNGVAPASWTLPSGTTLVTANATGTSFSNTGLTGSTNYCYLLVPFNWNAVNTQTYNYRTTATVPSTCGTTLVTPSLLSDIIGDATFTYTSNIDYKLYQATGPLTNTSNNLGVYRFTIRDGGSSSPDADAFPTILTGITFSSITGTSMIRAAALFDGNTMVSNTPTINTGTNTISFSGFSYSTTDDNTRNLTLRVSFLTTVTDSLQMLFSIASADVSSASGATSSQFTTFSTATSSNTLNRNRISVSADRIVFLQGASNATVSSSMTPSVTVRAVDNNLNTDVNFSGNIDITSSGSLTGSPVSASASNGIASYATLSHSAAGTGLTLTATSSGLSFSNTANSGPFDIINVPANSFRSITGGTWGLSGAGTSTWEQLVSGVWTSYSGTPPSATANNVYIRHLITTSASISPQKIYIESGGNFTINHPFTISNTLLVEKNATLQINASLTVSGTFDVQDTADVVLNFAYGTPSSSLWAGTENFAPYSNLRITNWDFAGDFLIPDNTSISTNTYNGYTACFGNVTIDAGANATTWIMLASGNTLNIAHNNLEFLSNSGNINVATTGTVTTGIGGDFIINDAYSSTNVVQLKTSGTMTFNLKGDLIIDAATLRVHSGSAAGASTIFNIDGNLNVTPSGVLEFNPSVSANASSTINLKGDLFVAVSGLMQNTNSSNLGILNFNGNGNGLYDSTTQTIDIASTSANENRYINFNVLSGAYIKLINRDFELGTNSGVYVQTGGVLDFGFNGTTALNVTISSSQTGTVFQSLTGSTLKITSPDGISTTGSIGNVRTVASSRSYNQTATFWYIGKANQVTGNGITVGSTPKVIICELIDNSTELSFTNSTSISSTTTVDATYGGHLYIKKGKVMETTTAYITGAGGTLRMESGTYYYIPKGNVDLASADADPIPRLSSLIHPSDQYYLNGGTIELAGSGAANAYQSLRGNTIDPKVYKNVVFSGANTYLTDYKNLTSTVVIDSTLYITGNAVVECIGGGLTSQSFTGTGALIMDANARIRFAKLSTPQPELLATSTSPARNYSLTGNSTVEFYGTSATQNQILRATANGNNISYSNIDINSDFANSNSGSSFFNVSASASFVLTGNFNINSPAVFRFDESENVSGTGNIIVNSGATLLYGSPNGIKSSGTGTSDGNIRISGTRSFSTGASYGFIGNGAMVSGNGLPTQMVNMYIDKQTAGDLITMTNDATVTGNIQFKTAGIIRTNSNTIYDNNISTSSIIGAVTIGTDKYIQGRLQRKVDGVSAYTFPIGHSAQNAQGFTINPTGTSGSNILGYLETNTTSPVQPVAYCDVETHPIASGVVNIGSGLTGTDGILDQIAFNLSSPLQWDVTNPGGGVSSYNITVNANGGQDISPITSVNGLAIRYLLKNGEPGNTGVSTGYGLPTFTTLGFSGSSACPNGYSLSGMTSFSKFTMNGASGGSTSLPVTLTSFNVIAIENNTAKLDWTTSSEINNDKFIIERSIDAINFKAIGEVKGNGNSTQLHSYNFVDINPKNGINYYRLKQVDFDGKYEYSPTKTALFKNENSINVDVYPNPSANNFNVELTHIHETISFTITDILGKVIYNNIEEVDAENNSVIISIDNIPSGNYILHIKGNSVNKQMKLIKQ